MRLRIRDTSLTLKIIGWQQIVGGIAGIGVIAYLMLQTAAVNGGVLLIFLTGLALFIYSIYVGKSLLTDENKRVAIILAIINQAFQLIQWSMFGYGLSYSSGAELTVGIVDTTFKFDLAIITSKFQMSINSDPDFLLKINLFAFLVMLVLVDILNEDENEPEAVEEPVQTGESAPGM
jgi:hypothetical protein